MPYDGNGVYTPASSPGYPAIANTPILAAQFNAVIIDIASALSSVVTRDGQSPATSNLSMAGNKLVNLGNGTATGDAVNFGQMGTDIAAAITTAREALKGINLIAGNTTLNNTNQWGVLHYVTTATTLTITLATPASNNGKLVYFSNITGNIVFITTPSGVINSQGLSATTIALGRGESLILTTDGTNYIQVARNGNGVMDLTSYTGTDIELAVGQTALYIPTAVTSQMLRLKTSDNQVYIRNAQDTGTIAGVNANIELQMNNTDYVGAHLLRVYVVDFATSAVNASGVTISRFGLNVRPSGYAIPYSCEIYTAAASRRKTVTCAFGEFSSATQTFGGSFMSVNDNATAWTSMGTEFYGRTYSGIISYTRTR